jgi:hypothetical protein
VTGDPLKAGGDAAFSIRQHQIALLAKEPASKDNIVAAKVTRQDRAATIWLRLPTALNCASSLRLARASLRDRRCGCICRPSAAGR